MSDSSVHVMRCHAQYADEGVAERGAVKRQKSHEIVAFIQMRLEYRSQHGNCERNCQCRVHIERRRI